MKLIHCNICINIVLLAVFLFASCKNSFEKEYDKLQGSKIVFPSSLNFYFRGDIFPMDRLWNSKFKLVVYKDSISCTPCYFEKLPQWYKLYDEKDRNTFNIIFILCPPKEREEDLVLLLKANNFRFPVVIDRRRSFYASNPQISRNSLFHVFLLNGKNQIILIGDPMNNDKVRELLYSNLNKSINN